MRVKCRLPANLSLCIDCPAQSLPLPLPTPQQSALLYCTSTLHSTVDSISSARPQCVYVQSLHEAQVHLHCTRANSQVATFESKARRGARERCKHQQSDSHRISAFVDASSLVRTSAPTCDSCRRCNSLSSASSEGIASNTSVGSRDRIAERRCAYFTPVVVRSDAGVSHAAQRLRPEREREGERRPQRSVFSARHLLRTAHTLSTRNDARPSPASRRVAPRRAFLAMAMGTVNRAEERSSSAHHITAHHIPYAQRLWQWHKSQRAVAPYCGAPPHARRMRDTTRHNSTQQATRHATARRGAARRGTAHHSAFRFS